MQNADDASAQNVEIHFHSSPEDQAAKHDPKELVPNLRTRKLSSIVVRNDGIVFREEDWKRLKKVSRVETPLCGGGSPWIFLERAQMFTERSLILSFCPRSLKETPMKPKLEPLE